MLSKAVWVGRTWQREVELSYMKSFFTSILLFGAIMSAVAAVSARQPNIIFILADDLSYRDLSCFGQELFVTPHIDRLGAEGRIFANAYAGAPWCAPSRTALLTGRTAAHAAPLAKDAKRSLVHIERSRGEG